MKGRERTEAREEILLDFHKTCNDPTAAEIVEWTRRFPEFADDIRAHAAILKDWAAQEDLPWDTADEALLSRNRSRALDALYNAQVALKSVSTSASRSFDEILRLRGTDVPQLARDLNIGRGILAAFVGGRMHPPIGRKFVAAVMNALAIAREDLDSALQLALATPRISHAKAAGTPTVSSMSYEDHVRNSDMTDEQKKFWLAED